MINNIVREHIINEKFTPDSDPIHDLGIGGIPTNFNEKRKELGVNVKSIASLRTWLHFLRSLVGKTIIGKFKDKDKLQKFKIISYASYQFGQRIAFTDKYDFEYEVIFDETYFILHHIDEKFTPESDPIEDMGIGKKGLIEKWLKEMKIYKYIINDDYSIDVLTDVKLTYKLNGNLPEYINFNYVEGCFLCDNNKMTTLRGCPKETGWYFDCSYNNLTSLDHMPKMSSNVYCTENKRLFTVEEVLDRCDVKYTIFVVDHQDISWTNELMINKRKKSY